MTDIRVRHVDNADGAKIGEIPFMEVDQVIPQLKRWGLRVEGEDVLRDEFSGEFVIEDDKAFFEVMVDTA